MGTHVLSVRDLRAGYGDLEVLHGVSFEVPAATTVALLGAERGWQDHVAGCRGRQRDVFGWVRRAQRGWDLPAVGVPAGAAIRSLLDSSRSALADAIFGPADDDLTLDQVVAGAGISLDLTPAELADMQDRLTTAVEPVSRAVESVLAYCHQRTVQGLTHRAVGEEIDLRVQPAPDA